MSVIIIVRLVALQSRRGIPVSFILHQRSYCGCQDPLFHYVSSCVCHQHCLCLCVHIVCLETLQVGEGFLCLLFVINTVCVAAQVYYSCLCPHVYVINIVCLVNLEVGEVFFTKG